MCAYSLVTSWIVAHRLLFPWDCPGKNTGVGCHFLLQGIFPTQGSNPGLPHCRQTLYPLSHQGSPGVEKVLNKLEFWEDKNPGGSVVKKPPTVQDVGVQ